MISFSELNDIILLHGFELSSQIYCNNLVEPIGLHVKILDDALRQIWQEELLCSFINAFLYFNSVA